MLNNYRTFAGKATVNNGAASAAVVAAPGAGKALYLVSGVVNVTVAATGGGGVVEIRDGATMIMAFDANAVGNNAFSFGAELGYPMTANTAINIVAASAATTQATANVALAGYIVG